MDSRKERVIRCRSEFGTHVKYFLMLRIFKLGLGQDKEEDNAYPFNGILNPKIHMKMEHPRKAVQSITVREFYEKHKEVLHMSLVTGEEGMDRLITEKSLNRPSIALTGFMKHFAGKRVQLFGAGEMGYLREQSYADQKKALTEIAQRKIPCIIVSRNLSPTPAMLEIAEKFGVPLFRTHLGSKSFTTQMMLILEDVFALTTTVHGTLLDIKGMGVLLRGPSGVGKSECSLALIERGHSLVADDLVYIKLLRDSQLLGYGSPLSIGFMECRGLGIINIAQLFGIRALRKDKVIDLVVTFVDWQSGMEEDRTGLEYHFYEFLGIKVPHVKIPVRIGRDMARLVEVAAMTQALKNIGYDPAKEFNENLIAYMSNTNNENGTNKGM